MGSLHISPSMAEQVAVFNSLRAMALTEREIMLGMSYPPGEFEHWLWSERASDSSAVAD